MRIYKYLAVVAFAASGVFAGVVATATTAAAGTTTATGLQFVKYSGGTAPGGSWTCSDWLNRSASGIVTEWRGSGNGLTGTTADSGCSPYAYSMPNSTILFKPYSTRASCDQANLVAGPFDLTYGSEFGPYTDATGYYGAGNPNAFWTVGQKYLVCFYPLAYRVQGNFTWWAYDPSLTRTTTFDIHSKGYGVNPGGTFSYSDTDSQSYTVSPTCVFVPTPPSPGVTNTAFWGGPLANLSAPLSYESGNFLSSKAIDNDPTNGDMYWGSFVTSDPCPSLGSSDPGDGPFTQAGGSNGQITSGDISITPIVG